MSTNTAGIVSASVIIGAPMLFTILVYISLLVRVRSASRGSYKPPVTFNWDYELTKANMCSFVFFIVFWLPLGLTFIISVVSLTVKKDLSNFKSAINNYLTCHFLRKNLSVQKWSSI